MVKMNLIERWNETLSNYINSEVLFKHFYSVNYINGVCERRKEIELDITKSSGWLVIFTVALAFFDTLSGQISFQGVTVNIVPGFRSIILLLATATLFKVMMVMIDGFIIDSAINTIGNKLNMYSFRIYLLDRMAINLWSEVITPQSFGLKSKSKQKTVFENIAIFVVIISTLLFMFPLLVIIHSIYIILVDCDTTYIGYLLSLLSLLLLFLSVLLPIVISKKYEFDEADFDELDGSPTSEFLARMQEEVEQDSDGDAVNPENNST